MYAMEDNKLLRFIELVKQSNGVSWFRCVSRLQGAKLSRFPLLIFSPPRKSIQSVYFWSGCERVNHLSDGEFYFDKSE